MRNEKSNAFVSLGDSFRSEEVPASQPASLPMFPQPQLLLRISALSAKLRGAVLVRRVFSKNEAVPVSESEFRFRNRNEFDTVYSKYFIGFIISRARVRTAHGIVRAHWAYRHKLHCLTLTVAWRKPLCA